MRRWQYYRPLNRLARIDACEGAVVPKSTLLTCRKQLTELVQPLIDAMRIRSRAASDLCAWNATTLCWPVARGTTPEPK